MNAWNTSRADSRITTTVAIAVAHRDPLVCAGLDAILRAEPDFSVRIVTASFTGLPDQWLDDCRQTGSAADVVVADYVTALALLQRPPAATDRSASPRVMVVSHRERESEIRHALDCGVHGYLLLGCGLDEMIFGVRALHRGQHHLDQSAAQRVIESLNHQPLTHREGDVLRLIAVGHVNKTIATELDISVGTVKAHVKAILAKFGARTRTEAAAIAQRRGLIGLSS